MLGGHLCNNENNLLGPGWDWVFFRGVVQSFSGSVSRYNFLWGIMNVHDAADEVGCLDGQICILDGSLYVGMRGYCGQWWA